MLEEKRCAISVSCRMTKNAEKIMPTLQDMLKERKSGEKYRWGQTLEGRR
jgi:hypothetical protein